MENYKRNNLSPDEFATNNLKCIEIVKFQSLIIVRLKYIYVQLAHALAHALCLFAYETKKIP